MKDSGLNSGGIIPMYCVYSDGACRVGDVMCACAACAVCNMKYTRNNR